MLRTVRLAGAALAAALLLPTTPALGATHLVAPGETLWGIALNNGLSASAVAAANGLSPEARVVAGTDLPPGWVGKPWALQQGLEAATGDVVVSLDADTRPRRGLAGALAAALLDADFVTAGARFACEGPGERLLHPSMLASLVYRYGPADTEAYHE